MNFGCSVIKLHYLFYKHVGLENANFCDLCTNPTENWMCFLLKIIEPSLFFVLITANNLLCQLNQHKWKALKITQTHAHECNTCIYTSVVTSHPCSSHQSSQVKSTRVTSQVKSLLFFFKSSQVKSFFPSSHLKSVWCSVFPFCKVTKIFRQLRGHLNDRT